ATFLLGFWKKEDFKHDFVLIQDGILLSRPELIDYWKNERKKHNFQYVWSSVLLSGQLNPSSTAIVSS
ncbi:MAG: hypothetical protein PVI60_04420, partial [Desulfobacteraceae bacterium]